MKAATYNPDTLNRIRRGACAADLGWDQSFYSSVCRKHGIEAMPLPAVTVAAPSRVAPVAKAAAPKPPHFTSRTVVFDRATKELARHGSSVTITLSHRPAIIIEMLADAAFESFVPGRLLAERGEFPRDQLGGYMVKLRSQLKKLELTIQGLIGRHKGGYRLVDIHSNSPVNLYCSDGGET